MKLSKCDIEVGNLYFELYEKTIWLGFSGRKPCTLKTWKHGSFCYFGLQGFEHIGKTLSVQPERTRPSYSSRQHGSQPSGNWTESLAYLQTVYIFAACPPHWSLWFSYFYWTDKLARSCSIRPLSAAPLSWVSLHIVSGGRDHLPLGCFRRSGAARLTGWVPNIDRCGRGEHVGHCKNRQGFRCYL